MKWQKIKELRQRLRRTATKYLAKKLHNLEGLSSISLLNPSIMNNLVRQKFIIGPCLGPRPFYQKFFILPLKVVGT
jgi:hypothetical protein